jgi:hypothetical protein
MSLNPKDEQIFMLNINEPILEWVMFIQYASHTHMCVMHTG